MVRAAQRLTPPNHHLRPTTKQKIQSQINQLKLSRVYLRLSLCLCLSVSLSLSPSLPPSPSPSPSPSLSLSLSLSLPPSLPPSPSLQPVSPFWVIAGCLLASLALGNVALRFVSYPVKVVLKSSKLLPAMLMGVLLLGRKYTRSQYLSALLLCVGVVGCTYADKWVDANGKNSSAYGVSLLLFAVCCDAVSPVVQERLLGKHEVPAAELMVRTNLIAFVGLIASWLVSCEWEGYGALPPLGGFWFPLMLCTYGGSSYVGVTFSE